MCWQNFLLRNTIPIRGRHRPYIWEIGLVTWPVVTGLARSTISPKKIQKIFLGSDCEIGLEFIRYGTIIFCILASIAHQAPPGGEK